MRIAVGALVNSSDSLRRILLQSEIPTNKLYICANSTSAPEGWNWLLQEMDCEVAVLCHQDVYFPPGWFWNLEKQLLDLPEWKIAGFFGINENGEHCGKIHDRRVPLPLATSHKLPAKALMVDGCCMAINMDDDFAFDEAIEGYDLYDVEACYRARETGRSVWIVDCPPEHYATRAWEWKPDALFMKNWNWLKKRFPERIISTCYRD